MTRDLSDPFGPLTAYMVFALLAAGCSSPSSECIPPEWDPNDCGTCFHQCGGDIPQCNQGVCTEIQTLLPVTPDHVTGLALTGDSLLFANASTIFGQQHMKDGIFSIPRNGGQ